MSGDSKDDSGRVIVEVVVVLHIHSIHVQFIV